MQEMEQSITPTPMMQYMNQEEGRLLKPKSGSSSEPETNSAAEKRGSNRSRIAIASKLKNRKSGESGAGAMDGGGATGA